MVLKSASVAYYVVDFYWDFEGTGRYGGSMVDKFHIASQFWIDEFTRFVDFNSVVEPLLPRGIH